MTRQTHVGDDIIPTIPSHFRSIYLAPSDRPLPPKIHFIVSYRYQDLRVWRQCIAPIDARSTRNRNIIRWKAIPLRLPLSAETQRTEINDKKGWPSSPLSDRISSLNCHWRHFKPFSRGNLTSLLGNEQKGRQEALEPSLFCSSKHHCWLSCLTDTHLYFFLTLRVNRFKFTTNL